MKQANAVIFSCVRSTSKLKSALTLNVSRKSGSAVARVRYNVGSPIMITLVSVGIGSGRSPWGGTKPKNAPGSSIRSSRFFITRCSASQTPALDKHVAIVEHQITAVGLADRTGLDQREVGHVTADDWFLFNDAEHVVISRIGFDDDRRPLSVAVVDEYVDSIGQKRIARRLAEWHRSQRRRAGRRLGAFEALQDFLEYDRARRRDRRRLWDIRDIFL